ncbi:MAG: putative aldouronate transport system permease protein [Clostridiales bacterium]|nr:putative aldouronate transport system permease protein [Clostridiales bacterium]
MGKDAINVKTKTREVRHVRKKGGLNRFTFGDFMIILILSLFGVIILYPFYNTILISIVPQEDYIRSPFMLIPKRITWESYQFVLSSDLLMHSTFVSAIATLVGTVYNMVLTVLMAYAFTKPIPGRNFFRFLVVFTMYFGGGLIPYYLLIRDVGLMDSFWVLVLPSVISVSYMLIISNYFSSLPKELIESASMDGASEMTILIRIILPLSLPILATFTLYYAVERWNEWWHGMLFLKDIDKWPLQLTLRKIIQDANFVSNQAMTGETRPPTYGEGVKMASIVVTMFPIMALYPFLQRYFITGLTLGAVKG